MAYVAHIMFLWNNRACIRMTVTDLGTKALPTASLGATLEATLVFLEEH